MPRPCASSTRRLSASIARTTERARPPADGSPAGGHLGWAYQGRIDIRPLILLPTDSHPGLVPGPRFLFAVLVIPYLRDETVTEGTGNAAVTRTRQVRAELFLSPASQTIRTAIEPEMRSYSIYRSVIFRAALSGTARFQLPAELAVDGVRRDALLLDQAELRFGVSDPRGCSRTRASPPTAPRWHCSRARASPAAAVRASTASSLGTARRSMSRGTTACAAVTASRWSRAAARPAGR